MSVLSPVPVSSKPTAQAFPLAPLAAMSFRKPFWAVPPGLGMACLAHICPFQCSMKPWSAVPLKYTPTAHALLAEVAATPDNVPPVPGCGLVTCAHFWPFQCRIKGWPAPPLSRKPTAQASVADTAPTALSQAAVPGLGLVTCRQVWPSQCRIRVRSSPPSTKLTPTAQTSAADTARTPSN
jgi:hypothetical protein